MWTWRNKVAPRRASHLWLGEYGEQLAVAHLKRQGYRIVATNFTTPLGHSLQGRALSAEIDIIAYDDKNTLVFLEVKTRSRADIALPQAAVDLRKQRQIVRAARIYRRMLHLTEEPYRYDVVSILVIEGRKPEIAVLEDYFHEARFARARWYEREF
jgi:putative endonuclease